MHLHVYTDGWSRGNPWPAWCGMYICTPTGEDIEKRYKYIGIATNNISEYSAAMYGISLAIERNATQITLYADSLLVIQQLKGTYKIKNEWLRAIYIQIQDILEKWWWKIQYVHIPRERNTEADRLSNVAMDKK